MRDRLCGHHDGGGSLMHTFAAAGAGFLLAVFGST
jgi:hypothetical protein